MYQIFTEKTPPKKTRLTPSVLNLDWINLDIDSPTYNNIYLEKSDNSELLLAKNVPAGSRVMSP